jgi:hypothetical protein
MFVVFRLVTRAVNSSQSFGQRRICGRTLNQETTSASCLNNFPCHASGVFCLSSVYISLCIELLHLLQSAS